MAAFGSRAGGDGGRDGGRDGSRAARRRSLLQLTSIARFVKSSADANEALSAAVVERPAVFQLMCQVR